MSTEPVFAFGPWLGTMHAIVTSAVSKTPRSGRQSHDKAVSFHDALSVCVCALHMVLWTLDYLLLIRDQVFCFLAHRTSHCL